MSAICTVNEVGRPAKCQLCGVEIEDPALIVAVEDFASAKLLEEPRASYYLYICHNCRDQVLRFFKISES
ncbi:MAG: hypothetical protein J7L98_02155 [Candidatus Verstraetearchaeota archaeon]|nr:hypothetical protein [Candidatus Verstraetearchaeota archaeon]